MSRIPRWFWGDVLAPFVATRLVLTLVGLAAVMTIPLAPTPVATQPSTIELLNVWSRWDGVWYLGIAREGYTYHLDLADPSQSATAFAPLLPALIQALLRIAGRDGPAVAAAAGIVVSNIALLVALVALVALARLDHDDATSSRAALYLLAFPASLFLSAVYPESLFLAFALPAVYWARTGRWWLAGAAGAFAALARLTGVVLVLLLALEYLAARGRRPTAWRVDALAVGGPLAGFALWSAYVASLTGDPLAMFHAHAAWARSLSAPWIAFANTLEGPLTLQGGTHSASDLAFAVLFVVLAAASWRWLRPSYAAYATALVVLMLSTGWVFSVVRSGLEMFPAFLLLALAGRRVAFDRAYLVVGVGMGAYFMALFALWYWVA